MLIAMLLTLLVINPVYLLWRSRRAGSSVGRGAGTADRGRSARPGSSASPGVAAVEARRWRSGCARCATRCPRRSIAGLQRGLPVAAVIAADGAGLGHELVLRHRELGGRHVELLGGVAHRHVARSDGARGARGRGRPARRRDASPCSRRERLRRFLVHRHRRHRRRRRVAARAARSAAVGRRTSPTCGSSSISSDVVYPDRLDDATTRRSSGCRSRG